MKIEKYSDEKMSLLHRWQKLVEMQFMKHKAMQYPKTFYI